MAKVMLVEDDNNLREIYEARLLAEGYEIVSARDGEEALVVAKQEKPDLIISDVMMPKISGFEMLDILRNTDGLRHVKVVMLTALGQADDKDRADKLGADKYLVKSQVTLEDIVKSARELLGDDEPAPAVEPVAPTATPPVPEPSDIPAPAPAPPAPDPQITVQPAPAAPAEESAAASTPAEPPVAPTAPAPEPPSDAAAPAEPTPLVTQSSADEQANIQAQIEDFVAAQPATPPAAAPAPTNASMPSAASDTPAPALSPAPNDAERDQSVEDAVNDLVASTAPETTSHEAPAIQPATPPVDGTAPVAPTVPAPTEPTVQDSSAVTVNDDTSSHNNDDDDSGNSDGKIANKKVIQPLDSDADHPDLDKLLAMEEAKEIIQQKPSEGTTPPPAQPGVQQPPQTPGGINPNDIAL